MNILVATDLGPASEKVVSAARRLAERTNADVTVLHVGEPDPDFVGFETATPAVRLILEREVRREQHAVKEIADGLREAGINAVALSVRGPTVATVLQEAERLDADTIVVGTHGHRAVYDMVVGSVSAGIIRKSPVPVLVVPTHG